MSATPLPANLREAEFQKVVIEYARLRGWRVHHSRPAVMRSGKWSTPVQGNTGLPDLVLARRGRVIFAELKTEKGVVSAEQLLWLSHLGDRGVVWRPSDWPLIFEILR